MYLNYYIHGPMTVKGEILRLCNWIKIIGIFSFDLQLKSHPDIQVYIMPKRLSGMELPVERLFPAMWLCSIYLFCIGF